MGEAKAAVVKAAVAKAEVYMEFLEETCRACVEARFVWLRSTCALSVWVWKEEAVEAVEAAEAAGAVEVVCHEV